MAEPYDEFVDFIVARIPARELAEFRSSDATNQRVWELIAKEKDGRLSKDEKSELDQFLALDLVMTHAKAVAEPQFYCA